MNRQMETPVNNNSFATSRSLNSEHPDNLNLYTSSKEFLDLLREVKIRFDTNPKFYLKEDFLKLIELFLKSTGTEFIVDLKLVDDWNKIINENTIPDGNLIKSTIEYIKSKLGNQYSEGVGIYFTEDEDSVAINANTGVITTEDIALSNGAPINALGIWEGDIIPEGTSVQTILEKLLNRELFPTTPTLPDFTVSNVNLGMYKIGDTATITAPITTKVNGHFNAPFTTPSQPPATITWSNETSERVISEDQGFTNGNIIELGENKTKYTFSKTYSAPSTVPITNLGNPYTNSSATWTETTITKYVDITATGVYPCFCNISNNTFTDNIDTETQILSLTVGNTITIYDTPSEMIADKHFKFAFPADRNAEFLIADTTKTNYYTFTSDYTIETINNFYNGHAYKIITTTGDRLGSNSYRFVLSKNLNQ